MIGQWGLWCVWVCHGVSICWIDDIGIDAAEYFGLTAKAVDLYLT